MWKTVVVLVLVVVLFCLGAEVCAQYGYGDYGSGSGSSVVLTTKGEIVKWVMICSFVSSLIAFLGGYLVGLLAARSEAKEKPRQIEQDVIREAEEALTQGDKLRNGARRGKLAEETSIPPSQRSQQQQQESQQQMVQETQPQMPQRRRPRVRFAAGHRREKPQERRAPVVPKKMSCSACGEPVWSTDTHCMACGQQRVLSQP